MYAFVPVAGYDVKAYYLGHNLHDHAAAAASNLLGIRKPFLERSVHYDALSLTAITDLAKHAERLGMNTLLALNKNAMALERTDAPPMEQRQRMTFGIYFYTEPADGNTS